MIGRLLRPFAVLTSLAGGALLANACGSTPTIVLCGEVPNGGCPQDRGGSCDDPDCEKIYNCEAGRWVVASTCGAVDDGGPEDRDGGDAGDANDGGDCTPFAFDHAGEVHDCDVDLQNPDCPAAAAEGCREQACTTGCEDFFLCLPDTIPNMPGVWTDVGYCDDDGALHVTQGT